MIGRGSRSFSSSRATCGMPLVAAGDVHYHVPARMVLHDVLTAIRHGTTVAAAEGTLLFPNAERHLRPLDEIRAHLRRRAGCDRADRRNRRPLPLLARRAAVRISDRARARGPDAARVSRRSSPGKARPSATRPASPEKVRQQIEHELELIGDLHYESYFLTVWDLVRFARSRNILCQGRGSAANSAVCFCLGVTSVDPATSDLLVRAVRQPRAERGAGHRRRLRARAARGGAAVCVREIRPRAGRAGRDGHHLLQPLGDSRRRQGARPVARSGRRAGQARRRLHARAEARAAAAARSASIRRPTSAGGSFTA